MPKSLCLNAIVRNESARILRMLESVAPHISSWVIVDTGSTDDTPKLIEKFFQERKIPGLLGRAEFKTFAQARNIALTAARHSPFPYDYLLLCDADMELVVTDPTWLDDVSGDSYDMFQVAGALKYQNRRLAKAGTTGEYVTPTHEYLSLETGGCVPFEKAYFKDYADGANRPEKFRRDIKMLKDELNNKKPTAPRERCMYYLAQSYRDAGKIDKAAKWYKRRVDAGGWDEEVWSAQECYASCLGQMGDEAGFVRETLRAYQMRPGRAETLYALAKHFREKCDNAISLLFSERGMEVPPSKDVLFVNDFVYQCGLRDEFAISAYYVPEKRTKGYMVANELSLKKSPYGHSRELARSNLFYYYPMLETVCPSFKWHNIDFQTEEGWVPLNPSIIQHGGVIKGIVRTVNYHLNEHGHYLIKSTGQPATADHPITTRNWFMHFDDTLRPKPDTIVELKEGNNIPALPEPPAFPLVIGYEDMRLFWTGYGLYASATVRELRADGLPVQTLVPILREAGANLPLAHAPLACEKNWMPICDGAFHGSPRWMYKLDEITDGRGSNIKHEVPFSIDAIGGGSQVIPFGGGYLGVVHEARQIPGQPTRYYSHRFVGFDKDLVLTHISPPFGFNEKGVEYCMGLAVLPRSNIETLVISYGFKDCEARIGTVSASDVERFLCLK